MKLVITSPDGWVVGWTKTKLILNSTHVELVVELGNNIWQVHQMTSISDDVVALGLPE